MEKGLTKKESADLRKINRAAALGKASRTQLMRGFALKRKRRAQESKQEVVL